MVEAIMTIPIRADGPCLHATLHSGLGNWLYICAEVALMHEAFELPMHVGVWPVARECQGVNNMQIASSDRHVRRKATAVVGTYTFAKARAAVFRWLFGRPRASVPAPRPIGTAIHLRTVSDVTCHTYAAIRACPRACVRDAALDCVARMVATAPKPVVVMSDARHVAYRLLARLSGDVHDEEWYTNASDHSGLSEYAGRRAFRLWVGFATATVRVASGGSTFSKSALLSIRGTRDYVVDTRCTKRHHTDGKLYTCRPNITLRDLV